MYVAITGSKNNKDVYIKQSFRKENGRTSSHIYKKLGKLNDLLEKFSDNHEKMMVWARAEARRETDLYNQRHAKVNVGFSQSTCIPADENRSFHVGYLFLQSLCTQFRLDKICLGIRKRHDLTYDLNAILTDFIYAHILSPSDEESGYSFCQRLLEPPKYSPEDASRALSVIAQESDFIRRELYQNANFVHPRNKNTLYYDSLNFSSEIGEITLGLFTDAEGIPLTYEVFSGSPATPIESDPLERQIFRDFHHNKLIFCSDTESDSMKVFSFPHFCPSSFIVPYSLTTMTKEDRDAILHPAHFRRVGTDSFIDLHTLDETNPETFRSVFYKDIPINTGNTPEILIVTYAPKEKVGCQKGNKDLYKGFSVLRTNLKGSVEDILRIDRQHRKIRETFSMTGKGRDILPVSTNGNEQIKTHCLTCYISLLICRLLEKKTGEQYTYSQIVKILRSMRLTLLNTAGGYIPSYRRTDITDRLHRAFGFRTDYEFMSKAAVRAVIKQTKLIP